MGTRRILLLLSWVVGSCKDTLLQRVKKIPNFPSAHFLQVPSAGAFNFLRGSEALRKIRSFIMILKHVLSSMMEEEERKKEAVTKP